MDAHVSSVRDRGFAVTGTPTGGRTSALLRASSPALVDATSERELLGEVLGPTEGSLPTELAVEISYRMVALWARSEPEPMQRTLRSGARERHATFNAIDSVSCTVDLPGKVVRCNGAIAVPAGEPLVQILGLTLKGVLDNRAQSSAPVDRLRGNLCVQATGIIASIGPDARRLVAGA